LQQYDETPAPFRRRRWRTVRQIAQAWPGVFTEPALRGLIHRADPHYDARGELVPGNGLAVSITRLGGKGGRVLIDECGFAAWLEAGLISAPAPNTDTEPTPRALRRAAQRGSEASQRPHRRSGARTEATPREHSQGSQEPKGSSKHRPVGREA
jgi:hypothetical protein